MTNDIDINYEDIQNILSNKISVTRDLRIDVSFSEEDKPRDVEPETGKAKTIEFIQMIQ
jgi:hypothetical protein